MNFQANELTRTLQERIASLEEELIDTKMQLACARSSEDTLKLQVANLSSALARAVDNSSSVDDKSLSSALENGGTSTPSNAVSVSTADPFSRGKKKEASPKNKKAHRAGGRKASSVQKKRLNPGSCASAMNYLLFLEDDGSVSQRTRSKTASASKVLKKNSCASGINAMYELAEGVMFNSAASPLQSASRGRNSGVSLTSVNMLLGSARLSSVTLLSRRSSRAFARLSRNMCNQASGNGNAEWGCLSRAHK